MKNFRHSSTIDTYLFSSSTYFHSSRPDISGYLIPCKSDCRHVPAFQVYLNDIGRRFCCSCNICRILSSSRDSFYTVSEYISGSYGLICGNTRVFGCSGLCRGFGLWIYCHHCTVIWMSLTLLSSGNLKQ